MNELLKSLSHMPWIEWLTKIFAWVGGPTAIIAIIRWLRDTPKVEGEIEQLIIGTIAKNGDFLGTNIMAQVYLVNTKIHPTTIRGWNLEVQIEEKLYQAQVTLIPDNLVLDKIEVDWSKNKLYDTAWSKSLELEKPIRGWLRFVFPDLKPEQLKEKSQYILRMEDSVGRKHIIKYISGSKNSSLMYYPDSGVKY